MILIKLVVKQSLLVVLFFLSFFMDLCLSPPHVGQSCKMLRAPSVLQANPPSCLPSFFPSLSLSLSLSLRPSVRRPNPRRRPHPFLIVLPFLPYPLLVLILPFLSMYFYALFNSLGVKTEIVLTPFGMQLRTGKRRSFVPVSKIERAFVGQGWKGFSIVDWVAVETSDEDSDDGVGVEFVWEGKGDEVAKCCLEVRKWLEIARRRAKNGRVEARAEAGAGAGEQLRK